MKTSVKRMITFGCKSNAKCPASGDRLIYDGRGDIHDVPGLLFWHGWDHLLGHVEEAGHVGAHHDFEVLLRVISKQLGDEDASVVDQQIDAAELLEGGIRHPLSGLLASDVPVHQDELNGRVQVLGFADRA
jgi:hypothetical protein